MGALCGKEEENEDVSATSNPVGVAAGGVRAGVNDADPTARQPVTVEESKRMDEILAIIKVKVDSITSDEFKNLFLVYDEDKSGFVNFKEFYHLIAEGLGLDFEAEDYELLSSCLDADGGRHIDMHELHSQIDDDDSNDTLVWTRAPVEYVDPRSNEVKEIERKVYCIYTAKNPDRSKDVPKLFRKYAGKEQKILAGLEKKYELDATWRGYIVKEEVIIQGESKHLNGMEAMLSK